MAIQMTQALRASGGSVFNINYVDFGNLLMMTGSYSSLTAAAQYIDTGMQEIFRAEVDGADIATFVYTAHVGNGMMRLEFSGVADAETGTFFIWGH